MPCTYCLSFVLYLNDQKAKNEGHTICTRHTYVQWSEDKERRTNNMYKAYLRTMIRRQRTKDKRPSFFVFWSLYIGMPCTYCVSFVLCLLIIVHRHALYILSVLRFTAPDYLFDIFTLSWSLIICLTHILGFLTSMSSGLALVSKYWWLNCSTFALHSSELWIK
jgi:hypothetical protein